LPLVYKPLDNFLKKNAGDYAVANTLYIFVFYFLLDNIITEM